MRLAQTPALVRDNRGRYYTYTDDAQVLVYDDEGRFVRAIGRRGDGPGEFSFLGPRVVLELRVGPGDSLFVFHPPKVTVFSPELAYVRTVAGFPAGQMRSVSLMAAGNWAISADLRTPGRVGVAVHVFDADGALKSSFGPRATVVPGRPYLPPPFVATSDNSSLWFLRLDSPNSTYSLQQWTLNDQLVRDMVMVGAPYTPPPTYVTRDGPRGIQRVQVGMRGLRLVGVDSLGQLWVYASPPGVRANGTLIPPEEREAGQLDVIDPVTGIIRLSQPADLPVQLLEGGKLAYRVLLDADGEMVGYEVLSFGFRSAPTPRSN